MCLGIVFIREFQWIKKRLRIMMLKSIAFIIVEIYLNIAMGENVPIILLRNQVKCRVNVKK